MLAVSVVMFAYNEEDNVAACMEEAIAFLQRATESFELILVDDGSSDGTADRARRVAEEYPGHVNVISYEDNRGIGGALKTGFAAAEKAWVTLMPADGQIPPEGLQRLFDEVSGEPSVDLVTCSYPTRFEEADSFSRKVLSRGLRMLTWMATGVRRKLDGIYLIRREVLVELPLKSESFFLNLELPIRALRQGIVAGATTMQIRPRMAGQSKVVHTGRILMVARELMTLGLELRTGWRP